MILKAVTFLCEHKILSFLFIAIEIILFLVLF